ncbi:MAG: peptide chain release factor N(5)-glutamine methyltransferase [Bryobacteraceae bacterium]
MTVQDALAQGTKLLEDEGISASRLTAEVLLARALRKDRVWLYAHGDKELGEIGWIHFGRYLHERMAGKPTQYITGRQEFYGREFRVDPAVLIPRPETEHVVEAALAAIRPGMIVVDVGCGSGAIAVTLALETQARVIATDISLEALHVAADNARRLGAAVEFIAGDLIAPLRSAGAIVCNPPYVPTTDRSLLQREVRDYEPPVALFAGETGLEIYRRLTADAPRILENGGHLILELGYNLAEPVRGMLGEGWSGVRLIPDLAGIPRVLTAQWKA